MSPSQPNRLRALDGLRLLAALAVALYHYTGREGQISDAWGRDPGRIFPTLHEFARYGCFGVELFFVISGFVICMSSWGRTLGQFARSRVSRLFPAYWVAVVLVAAVFLIVPPPGGDAPHPTDVLANLTMAQSGVGAHRVLGVCWTLWVEARFYLLFALCVVLRGVTYRRALAFGWLWLAASVLATASKEPFLQAALVPEYAPFFVGGLALFLIHRFGGSPQTWAMVGAGFLLGQYYDVQGGWSPGNGRSSLAIVACDVLAFAAVAAVALGALNRVNWRWLTAAGALTYPFYLVHEHLGWVVIHALHGPLGLPAPAVLAATTAVMLLLARLLNRYVEEPLGPRLKRALARPPAGLRPPEPRPEAVPEPEPAVRQEEPSPVQSAR